MVVFVDFDVASDLVYVWNSLQIFPCWQIWIYFDLVGLKFGHFHNLLHVVVFQI